MQDNWYEASISATAPHRIISVVDWASDAPIPDEPSTSEPATYNVFAWGINDPSVGNRSHNKENYDILASPVGWHAIPYANDPAMQGMRWSKNKGFFRNTTTTWGNNVSEADSYFLHTSLTVRLGLRTRKLGGPELVHQQLPSGRRQRHGVRLQVQPEAHQ